MFLVCHFCHQHLLDKFHLSQILQMCLLAKFGGHKSYRNGGINFYIKSYMNTLENAELSSSIRRISRFLKLGIPI